MKVIYTYYKNSNTGDIVYSQEFTETKTRFPVCWYRSGTEITKPDLTGYVIISERKAKRALKKQK